MTQEVTDVITVNQRVDGHLIFGLRNRTVCEVGLKVVKGSQGGIKG